MANFFADTLGDAAPAPAPAPEPNFFADTIAPAPEHTSILSPKKPEGYDPWAGFQDPDASMMPIVAPEDSAHILQGIGKTLVGAAGAVGDTVGAGAQKSATETAVAAEDGLRPGPVDESGQVLWYIDRRGNVVDPADVRHLTGEGPDPLLGSKMIFKGLKSMGIDPNSRPVDSDRARANEMFGSFIGGLPLMFTPGGAEEAGAAVPSTLRSVIGATAKAVPENAAAGGAAAALTTPGDTGERLQAAKEGAGTGALLGPLVHSGVEAGSWLSQQMRKIHIPDFGDISLPRAGKIGDSLADKIGPDGVTAVRDADPSSFTPGYEPTLAQTVPNPVAPGSDAQAAHDTAVTMERDARAANPSEFDKRRSAQQTSEQTAIKTVGGDGDPLAVGTELGNKRQNLTDAQQAEIGPLQQQVRDAVDATPPSAHTDVAPGDVPSGPNPVENARRHLAEINGVPYQPRDALGEGANTLPGFSAPELYGENTRADLLRGREDARTVRSGLDEHVNADNEAVVPNTAAKETSANMYDNPNPNSSAPSTAERHIADQIRAWGPSTPYADAVLMRNQITAAIDDATKQGSTVSSDTGARLQRLKIMLDRDINNQSGDTSILRGADQRLLTPDEHAARAHISALNQHIANTWDTGATGDILGRGELRSGARDLLDGENISSANGGFKVSDPDVMDRIWSGDRNEAANVRQYDSAGGNRDRLQSWAADDLRAKAFDEQTDTLDPDKYRQWQRDHRAGLNAMPQLKSAFDGVEQAQATVQAARDTHVTQQAAFETDAVKKFIGDKPAAAVKSIFESTQARSAPRMQDILTKIGDDAPANSGLKNAVGDYIGGKYRPLSSTGGTAADVKNAAKFNDMLNQHQDALKALYGDDGVRVLRQIGRQMGDRANVSPTISSRAPAKAETGDDGHGIGLSILVAEAATKTAEHVFGTHAGPPAAIVTSWLGTKVLNRLKGSGINTEGQLLNLAALNPTTVGKALLEARAGSGDISPMMSRRLLAAVSAAVASKDRKEP